MFNNPLKTLLKNIKINKSNVVFATICSVLNKICDIVPEILIGISIDVVVNQRGSLIAKMGILDPFSQLYFVGAITALFWILESVFEYLYSITWNDLAYAIQSDLRMQAYSTVQSLELSFLEKRTGGELLNILHDDINQLKQFLSQGPNEVIQLVTNIIVLGSIFFVLAPQIALFTLLPIPFVIIIAYHFQAKLALLYDDVRERSASMAAWISYRLLGIATIKSYTAEQYELSKLNIENSSYKMANKHASNVQAQYIPLVRMAIMAGFIAVLILGGVFALQGRLPINWYAALIFMSQRFLWPFTSISSMTDMYEQASACAKRILILFEHKMPIQEKDVQESDLIIKNGIVSFKDLTFGYSSSKELFKNFNLVIPSKKIVAFVGATGSGKSTIVKLFLRFYEYSSGSILIDGHDINSLSIDVLRKSIAFVSQEVYLVEGTIADNIRYGTFDASDEQVVIAAQAAMAHEFIIGLPDGYNTVVQEHGKNFSGGQRQRIAIARAIIKNSPIIIFDEATSAVDNETERAIAETILSLKKNHTIIIIAHRLITVKSADIICVLDQGTIVEQGVHDELIVKDGFYEKLWNAQ